MATSFSHNSHHQPNAIQKLKRLVHEVQKFFKFCIALAWWWPLWPKMVAINTINILLCLTEYIYNIFYHFTSNTMGCLLPKLCHQSLWSSGRWHHMVWKTFKGIEMNLMPPLRADDGDSNMDSHCCENLRHAQLCHNYFIFIHCHYDTDKRETEQHGTLEASNSSAAIFHNLYCNTGQIFLLKNIMPNVKANLKKYRTA